jgi:hypothetical protein
MALDFTTGVLDPRVTVARLLNTATRTNSGGLIEIVNANLPRFDYDPVTLAPKGLLIEEARTNVLQRSQEFDDVIWVKTRSSVTANATTSPDGTVNADKLVEDATAANNHFTSQSFISTAIAYTFTVYAKAAERGYITLFNGTVASGRCFDLITGVVGVASGTTPTASTITDVGNGWYRCSITVTATAASNVWRINVMASNSASTAYNGDGTSGIFIYGAQLEAGAFATSYIPTVASQVTRNADVVSMTGTNFSDWYNASAGTFFFRGSTQLGATRHFLNGPTTNDRFLSSSAAGSTGISDLTNSAVGGIITANTTFNATVSYGASGLAASLNGGASGTSAYSGVFASVNQLQIGRRGGLYMVGHIQKLNYYPQELTLSEMSAFSK